MKAYHGTKIGKIEKFLAAIKNNQLGWHGFYVTESFDLAARYANAQATEVVDADATELRDHAAVIEFDVPDTISWMRRPVNHHTLDVCEAIVKDAAEVTVTRITVKRCDYWNCTCQRHQWQSVTVEER